MTKVTYEVALVRDGSMCYVPITFDPKVHFGRVRAPVKVSLNGYTYRTTIASMGDVVCVPLRKSHREAAGLEGDETLPVTIELDTAARTVSVPAGLQAEFSADDQHRWAKLSYTRQREWAEAIEGAKRPETKQRRIADALSMLRQAT